MAPVLAGDYDENEGEGNPPKELDASKLFRIADAAWYQEAFEFAGFMSISHALRAAILNTYRIHHRAQDDDFDDDGGSAFFSDEVVEAAAVDDSGTETLLEFANPGQSFLRVPPRELHRILEYLSSDSFAWVALPQEVRDKGPEEYAVKMRDDLGQCAEALQHAAEDMLAISQDKRSMVPPCQPVEYKVASEYLTAVKTRTLALKGAIDHVLDCGSVTVFLKGEERPSVIGRVAREKRQLHLFALHGIISAGEDIVLDGMKEYAASQLSEVMGKGFAASLDRINTAFKAYAKCRNNPDDGTAELALYDVLSQEFTLIGPALDRVDAHADEEDSKHYGQDMYRVLSANLRAYLGKARDQGMGGMVVG